MKEHTFIFSPGKWEGKGKITFSMAEDELSFSMSWTVLPEEEGKILFSQKIEVDGFNDPMNNHFCASSLTPSSFSIQLENHLVGKVFGKGLIDPKVIAWEFRNTDQAFEGFEIYELQPNGSYSMRAEFTAGDNLRTYVSGHIHPLTQS